MRGFINKEIILKVIATVMDEISSERKKQQWEEKEKLSYDIVRYYEELDVELRTLEDLVRQCRVSATEVLNQGEVKQVLEIKKLRDACTEENLLRLDSRRLDMLLNNLQTTKRYIADITFKINDYAEKRWIMNQRMKKYIAKKK